MASIQFQIHKDKENVTSTNFKTSSGLSHNAKTFNPSNFHSLKTPRRALGSVNEAHRVGGGKFDPKIPLKNTAPSGFGNNLKPSKSLIYKESKPKKHANKENEVLQQKPQSLGEKHLAKKKPIVSAPPPPSFLLPEMEYMPPSSPLDLDDDILPAKERASTYVSKLFSWRPQCLFGSLPDSDSEDELRSTMEELDNIPVPEQFCIEVPQIQPEDINLDDLELPSMDDFELPMLSPLVVPEPTLCSTANNTYSELDDTAGSSLSQYLGQLELLDDSNLSLSTANSEINSENNSL